MYWLFAFAQSYFSVGQTQGEEQIFRFTTVFAMTLEAGLKLQDSTTVKIRDLAKTAKTLLIAKMIGAVVQKLERLLLSR